MTWSSGYVTEVEYTYGYYSESHPSLLALACIYAGVSPPQSDSLHYLELGYGQGLGINFHASAFDGTFWGTDFNPVQAARAQALSAAAANNAILKDDSFSDLAARKDLPDFDFIVLHGIWTWVSDDSRRAIVDIIKRKLKVGGIVYNSYNCKPGWAPAEPLRHLMTLYSDFSASESKGTLNNITGALDFCEEIASAGALYFQGNPSVRARLTAISSMNKNYLAHEYFNQNWELMSFSDMVKWLSPAKVEYVCSAHLLDHIEPINIGDAGRRILDSINHTVLKESVRDYFVNQQFRRDIFIKGPRRLLLEEQRNLLRAQLFVLTSVSSEIPKTVQGALGAASLQADIYEPVVAALAMDDYRAKTIDELLQHPDLRNTEFSKIVQALVVLVGAGHVFPAVFPTPEAKKKCTRLNAYLRHRAEYHDDVHYQVSPVTRSGVALNRIQQLILLARDAGLSSPEEQAPFVSKILLSQGQTIVKDGKAIEDEGERLAELVRLAADFAHRRLPVLQALEIA